MMYSQSETGTKITETQTDHTTTTKTFTQKSQTDAELPEFTRFDYLTKLFDKVQKTEPKELDTSKIQDFVALATRGIMYALQSPYPNHVMQFALASIKANSLQIKSLTNFVKNNFKQFKKSNIKNKEKFLELLEHMSNSCDSIRDKLTKAKLNDKEYLDALSLIANYAKEEQKVYNKIHELLEPSFKSSTNKPMILMQQLTKSIKVIFEEIDTQLTKYVEKNKTDSVKPQESSN